LVFFLCSYDVRYLLSFPTRRSSDLEGLFFVSWIIDDLKRLPCWKGNCFFCIRNKKSADHNRWPSLIDFIISMRKGVFHLAEHKKQSFFEGAFGRYVLLGVVIQSTLIGGGYATGREVVAYGGKFGAIGWITGLTILVGFAVMAFLMFEVARLFRAYDYRSLVKQILGPFWFLYDIIYFLLAILMISIVVAATGSILEST